MSFPKDWEIVPISEIAEIIVSSVDKHIIEGEKKVPVCNYTDVYNNRAITIKLAESFRQGSVTEIEYKKFKLQQHDVIITKDSETPDDIGIPAYVAEAIPDLVCGYHLAILRPKNTIYAEYLHYTLQTPIIKYRFYQFANGITRFGLTQAAYNSITLPLPPLEEQKRIAALLGAQDRQIEALSALIALRQRQFRGLVQALISTPAKTGRWNMVELGEVCKKQHSTISQNTLEYKFGNYPVYGATGVIKNIDSYDLEIPYIAIIKDGAGAGRLQLCPAYSSVISTLQYILATRVNLFFLYYLMQTMNFNKYISGSTIPHIYFRDYSHEVVPLPSAEEQERIASILGAAQRLIACLERKRELCLRRKKGLMQVLLTGKVRV